MPIHPAFIHLRLHSEYSILDSTIRIDEVVSKAVADQMPALALTDLSNLFGLVKFYQSTYRNGIKPILGCDVWITNESDRNKPVRLLLLCQSHAGYLLLSRLLSRAYRENQYHGRAEIKEAWLHANASGAEGLFYKIICRMPKRSRKNGPICFQIDFILSYKETAMPMRPCWCNNLWC